MILKNIFDKSSSKLKKLNHVVLWGSGGLCKQIFENKWIDIKKIKFILDSNKKKSGKYIHGIKIFSPEQKSLKSINCIVIATSAYSEVFDKLKKLGYKKKVLNAYELLIFDKKIISEFQKLKVDIAVQKRSSWIKMILNQPQILVNISFRMCKFFSQSWYLKLFYPFFRVFHAFTNAILCIYIPLSVEAGPGLSFAHYGSIIFRANIKIGSFCTIYHNCTLGSDENGNFPNLGSFVTIYTGSTLIGSCELADYTRVGAHSLCINLKTNAHCTVIGNPAKERSIKIINE